MSAHAQYVPGPAYGAQAVKEGALWTLILIRELRHSPEKVWRALSEPEHLHEWAPFDADGNLTTVGATVRLTWVGTGNTTEVTVTRADAPRALEFGNMRWELDSVGGGTRLKLWHSIPQRYISWGAAGWHICFDVLDRCLAGDPMARIAGPESSQIGAWQRLVDEYARQFDSGPPAQEAKAAQTS